MRTIALLDQQTIDKIAAGEVVERPSSVVKELVENSIDAGAGAVTVEISQGGKKLIRITDNGCGIPKEELPLAFASHATSKLKKVEDLDTISSLGFRGEALCSIAAVSQVEVITKTPSALTGVRYLIEGGQELSLEEIGAPDGTTFLVRNLFYNTPARSKFLKTDMSEALEVSSLIEQLALSHPHVAFKYIQNNQVRLHTSGTGRLKDVIYNVYGRDITGNLYPVAYENDFMKISGFAGKPEIARGNRGFENYYINGRYVKNVLLAKAIEDAYKGKLMQHKYPFVTLKLEMDGSEVDVNVHPRKLEVRFARSAQVYDAVYEAVHRALTSGDQIPSVTPGKPEREAAAPVLSRGDVPEPFEKSRSENTGSAEVIKKNPALQITREDPGLPENILSGSRPKSPGSGTLAPGKGRSESIALTEGFSGKAGRENPDRTDAVPAGVGQSSIGSADNTPTEADRERALRTDTAMQAVNRPAGGQSAAAMTGENTAEAESRSDLTDPMPENQPGSAAYFWENGSASPLYTQAVRETAGEFPENDIPEEKTGVLRENNMPEEKTGELPGNSMPEEKTGELPGNNIPEEENGDHSGNNGELPDHNMPKQKAFESLTEEAGRERIPPEKQEAGTGRRGSEDGDGKQLELFGKGLLDPASRSRHRLIGQLFDTYWLVEFGNDFYLIDQHAAHEKITYERMVRRFREKEVLSQYLRPARIVTLSMEEEAVLKESEEIFKSYGFEIEHYGGREYCIRAVPADLYGMTEEELFHELLDRLPGERKNTLPEVFAGRLASMSCKAAIKGGSRLSAAEANAMIDELLKLEDPYHCPHGRPTIISMSKAELEKKFHRIV